MMHHFIGWTAAAGTALLSLLLGLTGAPAPLHEDDVNKVDLSELADGEQRAFGEGAHRITATREGDLVILTLGPEGPGAKKIECNVEHGSCFAFTTGDGGAGVKVVMLQSDEDTVDKDVRVMRLAPGDDHDVRVLVESLGDGKGPATWIGADHHAAENHTIVELKDAHIMAFDDDRVTLRCPQGDATMRLDEDQRVGTYLCPQHNVELEEVKGPRPLVRRLVIETETDEADEQ